MGPAEMIVAIVLIVTIGQVMRAKVRGRNRDLAPTEGPEARQLREEVVKLRDRVAVLERIATDKNHLLEQEFERLRDS